MNEENCIAVNILGRGVMSCCYTVGTLGITAFRTKSNNTLWCCVWLSMFDVKQEGTSELWLLDSNFDVLVQ